jgi:UDP-N-acetylmuramate: L-alanyl-gamma-D-glutamyl-meso-diaminopimelate ligase
LAKSLSLADEVIVANVFRSEVIPEAERLDLDAVVAMIQQLGGQARTMADADTIVHLAVPEMRSGDVVAILSNGGFGGIYEKLPRQLQALAARAGNLDVTGASAKA